MAAANFTLMTTCIFPMMNGFKFIVRYQCPVLAHTETSYQLDWPYDRRRGYDRYGCGKGPRGQVRRWANETLAWEPSVHLLDAPQFASLLRANHSDDWCMLAIFYAPHCPFSAAVAPLFNVFPRMFPGLYVVALDATRVKRLSSRYGISAVPTLVLFHNGKPVTRYDDDSVWGSKSLNTFAMMRRFIVRYTDSDPDYVARLERRDLIGPLRHQATADTDWYLVLSWAFIAACSLYYGSRLRCVNVLRDNIRKTWTEVNENAAAEHLAGELEREETEAILNRREPGNDHVNGVIEDENG